MPEKFVSKMANYVAFLYRSRDVWVHENLESSVELLETKIETVRDICTMFNCRVEVWRVAKEIYDWEE